MSLYLSAASKSTAHEYRTFSVAIWGKAKSDFETARQTGVLVASSFCAIFGGVPDFEARYGVQIPSDNIAHYLILGHSAHARPRRESAAFRLRRRPRRRLSRA